jgi:dUTP pyrophosphatase
MNLDLNVKILDNGNRAGIDVTPKYAGPGESGLELYVLNTFKIKPYQQVLIPHGIAIQLPEGFEGQIRPRSSSYGKKKIEVILGTIDASYRGELMSSVIYRPPVEGLASDFIEKLIASEEQQAKEAEKNGLPTGAIMTHIFRSLAITVCKMLGLAKISSEELVLNSGDRISQLVIAPIVKANVHVVDNLSETFRGDGGFGSTGGHT